MRIGIDIDGTLAEPMELLCKKYGIEIPSIWNYFETKGMTKQFLRDFESVWKNDWKIIPLIEQDAPKIMNSLVQKGVKFDAVTAMYGSDKSKWIDYHNLPCDDLIEVEHGIDKALYDYDMFVDDSPVNYNAFVKAGKTCALFDRSWNRHIDAEIRISSILEISNHIT